MGEISLKATALAMSMILGVAMALAAFINYGPSAIQGALADIRGPLTCTYVNRTEVAGSALCAGAPVASRCHRVLVSYAADDDSDSGGVQRIALLHPSFVRPVVANATYCKKVTCGKDQEMKQLLSGHTEHDAPGEHFYRENRTMNCLVDTTSPGHAFYLKSSHHRLIERSFTRLEAIFVLLAGSVTLIAVAVGLTVCCHRKLLTADVVLKDDVKSYVKIGDKYYAKASFKAKVAMVTVLSRTTKRMAKQDGGPETATASTSAEPIQQMV